MKEKQITGYPIDPFRRVIEPVEIKSKDGNFLPAYYEIIGCDLIDVVRLDSRGHAVIVDDEGLCKNDEWLLAEGRFFHILNAAGQPLTLTGRGIVVSTDADGNDVSPSLPITLFDAVTRIPPPEDMPKIARWLIQQRDEGPQVINLK